MLAAAGYPDLPSTQSVFFGERGSESFKGYGVVDLSVSYNVPVLKSVRPVAKRMTDMPLPSDDVMKAVKSIYEQLGSRIGYHKERTEVTYAFTGAGLGLMLFGSVLSLFWFGRLP